MNGPAAGSPEASGQPAAEPTDSAELGRAVARLTGEPDLSAKERARLAGTVTAAVGHRASAAGRRAVTSGRWVIDLLLEIAPHLPVRDAETLSRHHHGRTGDDLAASVVRAATRSSVAIGALFGTVAGVEYTAPALLLTAPAMVTAELLVQVAVEMKLVAELHHVYGVQLPERNAARAVAIVTAWGTQHGFDPAEGVPVTGVLTSATKIVLRRRLLRQARRGTLTYLPFFLGAAAGARMNATSTKRVGERMTADLSKRQPPASSLPPPRVVDVS